VAFSPDGQQLAAGCNDGVVRVWKVAHLDEAPLALPASNRVVGSVAFSQDGQQLAAGCDDGVVRVWDAPNFKKALPLLAGVVGAGSMAFSPDGQRLAAPGEDGMMRIWDARGGQEVLSLEGLPRYPSGMFSSDGFLLALGGINEVLLFDATPLRSGR
jgi:WD40 repeat protein